MDDTTSRGINAENERTCVLTGPIEAGSVSPGGASPLGPREAFLIAYDRLSALAEAAPERALAIVAVDAQARIVDALFLPDRAALVIGRHTQCRLRLPDSSVSLRHIALLARFDEGQPRIHLWDLNTGRPFKTESGEHTLALIAEGPVYLSIDEYAVWIVPAAAARAWPPRAKDAWAALPERAYIDRRGSENEPDRPPHVRMPSPRPRARPRRAEEITHITMVQSPLLLAGGDEPEVGWGTLRFAFAGQKERRKISAERLERGVLIGRYDRCGLTFEGLGELSRVHLLLVRIGDEVWAIDTASTHGMTRGDAKVQAIVLADHDRLTLARVLEIEWAREQHPCA